MQGTNWGINILVTHYGGLAGAMRISREREGRLGRILNQWGMAIDGTSSWGQVLALLGRRCTRR